MIELERIANDVYGLSILILNTYAFSQPSDKWMLVDCGLTTRAVEDLSREWNVPVFAHPLETLYFGGGLMPIFSKMYPRGPVNVGSKLKLLTNDGGVSGFADCPWIHTAGQTSGHMSFFCERSGFLAVGDTFATTTTKQESFLAAVAQPAGLYDPPAYFTSDWDAPCDSIKRLAALRPSTVPPDMAVPLSGADVAGTLGKLACDFDIIARPQHGRSVNRPAA